MVSITVVSAGQAGRYYIMGNYYSSIVGEWQGSGAQVLALTGPIKKKDFLEILKGKPPDGSTLVHYEPRYVNGKLQKQRSALDLTFSGPKGVSVIIEILGDQKVKNAFHEAVSTTLNYVERNFSNIRQTEAGVTSRVTAGNLTIAKFTHDVSRSLDPAIHCHCVVMNIAQRSDGLWRSISNEEIFRNKMLIGQVFRNELAANLKELGYSIRFDDKGLFEILGIDQRVLDHFSQRSVQINEKEKEFYKSGAYPYANQQKLREIATLSSRDAKKDVDLAEIQETWNRRLTSLGYSKKGILQEMALAKEKSESLQINETEQKCREYGYLRTALLAITEQEAVFSRETVLKTALKLSVGRYRVNHMEKAFDDLVNRHEIVKLAQNIYSTREMQKIEKKILNNIKSGHNKVASVYSTEQLRDIIRDRYLYLTKGQQNAVMHILSNKDTVNGVQGDAGTGKTCLLASVKTLLEGRGYNVVGLAYTGKAAEELQKNACIPSQTIHSFLARKDSASLTSKHFLFIDEASMVSSRQMHELITVARDSGSRVVMIGDVKQLQSIQSGCMFSKLQESGVLKTVEMTEITRQSEQNYRSIVASVSKKNIDEAFDKLRDQSRIVEIIDDRELKAELIKEYTSRDYRNTIIVTPRNSDRRLLNHNVRQELKLQGNLKGPESVFTTRVGKGLNPVEKHFAQGYEAGNIVTINKSGAGIRVGAEGKVLGGDEQNHEISVLMENGERRTIDLNRHGDKISVYQETETPFIKGDKVVFTKNDKTLGVQNGLTGTIVTIHDNGDIDIKTDAGKEIMFNIKNEYNHVDHAYVISDYKSQGQTAKSVIYHAEVLREREVSFNSFYVGITRGKEDMMVFTDSMEALKEDVKTEQVKTSTLDYDKDNHQEIQLSQGEKSQDQVKEFSVGKEI